MLLYSLILLMVVGWSFNFVIAKITLRHLDPYTLTSFRIIFSGVFMLPIYFAMPRRSRFNRKDLWNFVVLGFFGVVINRGFFIVGLDYTTAARSALIVATGPIFVLVLARAYKLEQITRGKIIGMALCLAGIAVLVGGDALHFHGRTGAGDLVAIGGTIGFAVYTVLAKKVARQYDTISMNMFCNMAGAIMLLPMGIEDAARLNWSGVGWIGWVGLAYDGVQIGGFHVRGTSAGDAARGDLPRGKIDKHAARRRRADFGGSLHHRVLAWRRGGYGRDSRRIGNSDPCYTSR